MPDTNAPAFLILDDDPIFADTLARALGRRGYAVAIAHDGPQALALAQQQPFDYLTVDLHLANKSGSDSGLQWIAPLRAAAPHARMLVLTGYASIATAVQAVKLGADDYLAKPANADSILAALKATETGPEPVWTTDTPLTPLSVPRLEWEHIQRVLAEHQGNISATARALNMHRRTLQRKLGKRPVKT